jgi:hypothetical protein
MKDVHGEWGSFLALWAFASVGGFLAGRGLFAAAAVVLCFALLLAAGGYATALQRERRR